MGLLIDGQPLPWSETRRRRDHVNTRAAAHIIRTYAAHKHRQTDPHLWGDELSLAAHEALDRLMHRSSAQWHPEYARWMIEGTPLQPYTFSLADLSRSCELSMAQRRYDASMQLRREERLLSLAAFPALGTPNCLWGSDGDVAPDVPHSRSRLLPDAAISAHPRFATITTHIRQRRGSLVAIDVPLYAPAPSSEGTTSASADEPREMLRLDAMGFGMGLCCLQTTIQCPSLDAAKRLYDQLAVVAPILLALTASTPALYSRLLDIDARWDIISASVDDRTSEERLVVAKGRYATISTYLSSTASALNDTPLPINVRMYDTLVRKGSMDPALARHFSYLFIRDPLVLYDAHAPEACGLHSNDDDALGCSPEDETLFECIQSTNWNTVRLKLPSDSLRIPTWRVEFRPMEAQVTDFESAAFVIFIQLIASAIVGTPSENIVPLIPISLLDENMARAQRRDAARNALLYWVKEEEAVELTVQEIASQLLAIARTALKRLASKEQLDPEFGDTVPCGEMLVAGIERYLLFIEGRVSGAIPTSARAIREFILAHPSYTHDGAIPHDTLRELLQRIALHAELNVPVLRAL